MKKKVGVITPKYRLFQFWVENHGNEPDCEYHIIKDFDDIRGIIFDHIVHGPLWLRVDKDIIKQIRKR